VQIHDSHIPALIAWNKMRCIVPELIVPPTLPRLHSHTRYEVDFLPDLAPIDVKALSELVHSSCYWKIFKQK
jgi:hypothetical protein